MNITPKQITLYCMKDYAQSLDKAKIEVSYDEAISLLDNDQDEFSYHIRLYNNSSIYPLFCDIDGTAEQLAKPLDEIISHFTSYFKQLIITKSETTKKNSYHIILPSYEATIQTQKDWWQKWNEEHPDYLVDLNVYKTTLFRLPNQLKPYSGEHKKQLMPETRHRIIQGQLKDFLFEQYEDAQLLNTPEKHTSYKPNNGSAVSAVPTVSSDISKYIDCLSEKRASDYKTWTEVGFCLRNIEKNEDENLQNWITFSQKATFPDTESHLTLWYCKNKSKTAEEKAFRIGSLRQWAKQDNHTLYQKYFPTKCLLDTEGTDAYSNDAEPYLFIEWEKTHCKILNPPSYMEHKITQEEDRFILRTTKALEQSFSHLSISINTLDKKGNSVCKKTSFINSWTKMNDKIKLFDEVGIYPYPLKCPANIFNCWASFRGDLLPKTMLSFQSEFNTFKQLISVLCGHEQSSSDYLLKWIAQAIQFPAYKTTVPTIISKQGAGKGTLIKMLSALLGANKVLSTTNADVVFGKFNNQMLDAFLVNLDELSPKDVKDVEHKIKGLITEPYISIDIKGVSSFSIKSYHRFINTTNNEFGVFKTEIGDRRNFIVRASDELIGNKEFFTNFNNNIINNSDVISYIYNYLKTIPDLDRFHEAGNIPATQYGDELKQASRNDYDLWLEDFTKRNNTTTNNSFLSSELFQDFTKFVKKDCYKNQTFGIRILNIVSGAITKGKHTRQGETKDFNWDILRKHYKTECLIDDDELSNASTTELYIDGILQAD
jgi:hypothetical protein